MFNEWKVFHNLDIIKSIANILEDEFSIKDLVDMLSFFVKDGSLYLPNM